MVKKMLEDKGYVLYHISGSHHKFVKPGCLPVSIPVHGNQVKYAYYRLAQKTR